MLLDSCGGALVLIVRGFGGAQVLSGVALLSYRAAKAPKDKEHPYGQSRSLPVILFHSSYICSYVAMTGWYC
jgi:divalent metal cation (Fe/Co/Zn/Cd) transporter